MCCAYGCRYTTQVMVVSATPGMQPPPVIKPPPKPKLVGGLSSAHPTPEFMWCQRSDRVYVTIKVADCKDAKVNISGDSVLEFSGLGHGMCGERHYELNVELRHLSLPPSASGLWREFPPTRPDQSVYLANDLHARPARMPLFSVLSTAVLVSLSASLAGPNVRVRLQKAKVGPYWDGLLAGKRKMVQLKVDWASWLDEDEENERSAAPTGFDVDKMKVMMVGSDKCDLYRDLDRFDSSTTPDEGEETNSIMIDEGMSTVDDLQVKFKALEYEKEETAKTKERRFQLRKKTREAQLFKQRDNDLLRKRPVRDLTPEEIELLEGADTLYERLKAEKKQEKMYWLSKWWHVRRPEKRKIDMAEPVARKAAVEAIETELKALRESGGEISDKRERRAVERRVFIKSRQAALDVFNQWEIQSEKEDRIKQDQEGRDYTARDMGARITREELAKALGEPMPDLAKSMQLKQFADPRPKDEQPQRPGGGSDDEASGESEYSSSATAG